MTTEELKNKILCIIQEVYNYQGKTWRYNGRLKIRQLSPVGYSVTFGLNNIDKPLVISAELSDDKFLKFIKDELRSRHFNNIQWFIGEHSYPDNGCPIKKGCACD